MNYLSKGENEGNFNQWPTENSALLAAKSFMGGILLIYHKIYFFIIWNIHWSLVRTDEGTYSQEGWYYYKILWLGDVFLISGAIYT